MKSCSVIVPVFNEEQTIIEALHRLYEVTKSYPLEIVVVESNSVDNTRQLLVEFSNLNPIKLILQPSPRGKGNAVIEGLKNSSGEIVAIMDGDLEYSASDLLLLLKPINEGKATFVLGNRHVKGEPMRVFPGHRLRSLYFNIGHELFTGFFNLLYGTRLKDPATMWKVFLRSQIENYEFTGQRFEFDWEVMATLAKRKAKILEIPISYQSRGKEEGKKIRAIRDPLLWLYWIVAYRFRNLESVKSK
jgi:glycosyltransferase involved in cell wall biosynthesis